MNPTVMNVIAIAYYPAIVLIAFVLWKNWRKITALNDALQGLIGIGSVTIFTTTLSIIGSQTAAAVAVEYSLLALAGCGMLYLAALEARVNQMKNREKKWLIVILLGCFGLAISGVYGRLFVLDFFAPRIEVAGTVGKMDVWRGRLTYFHVLIDGKRYHATGEVYDVIEPKMRIRAETGAGSGTIYRVTILGGS